MSEPLLRAEGLTRHFSVGKLLSRQRLHAVDDVNFEIGRGEIVGGGGGGGKSDKNLRPPHRPREKNPAREKKVRDHLRGQAGEHPEDTAAAPRLLERRRDGLPGPV